MKHFTLTTRVIITFFAVTILLSSCSSTTLIESYPSGADLYLNGEAVGKTPYHMTDTKPMFSCTTVHIEKENYQPLYTTICRDEEADAGAIIGGLFFWVPFAWSFKYKPTHYYKLLPSDSKEPTINEVIKEEKQGNQ